MKRPIEPIRFLRLTEARRLEVWNVLYRQRGQNRTVEHDAPPGQLLRIPLTEGGQELARKLLTQGAAEVVSIDEVLKIRE